MEKQLRKIVDKYKPAFSKGGKFGFLHSTFDAFETFLVRSEYGDPQGKSYT